jgi:hypothetical protein
LLNIPQHPGINGNPEVDIQGFAGLNNVGTSSDTINIYQLIDNATVIRGRHSLKGGLILVDTQDAHIAGATALFSDSYFSGEYTGYAYSDFLLGLPQTTSLYSPRVKAYERSFNYGAYIEDTWRVNDRLTLDLGVRWQVDAVPFDKGGLYYNFDPANGAIVVPSAAAQKAVIPGFPSSIPIITAAQAGFPSKLMEPQYNQFLPRIGVAYRPWGDKTVITLGYGMYSLPPQTEGTIDSRLQTQGPFSLSESYTNETPAQTGTGSFLWQWPDAVPSASGAVPSQSITGVAKDYRIPYKQQWAATFEHQIGDWSVRASYIGERDKQSGYQADINLPPASTTPFSLSELVYPGFRHTYLIRNGANLSYNALQIITTHQQRKGLTLSGGLTWARKMTDSGSGYFDGYADAIQNPRNLRGDYGRAFDAPTFDLRFQTAYELPFGRGKMFLGAPNSVGAKIADKFVGGWVISAIPFWRTGLWVTPSFSGPDPSNTGVTSGRPDLVPGCNPASVPGGQNKLHWFNVACYTIPANGTYGNAPVGSIEGPSETEVDIGINKDFVLAGGPGSYLRDNPVRLRIGMISTDFLNNVLYATPNTNISAPTTAGTITSTDWGARAYTDSGARNISFDVRLIF